MNADILKKLDALILSGEKLAAEYVHRGTPGNEWFLKLEPERTRWMQTARGVLRFVGMTEQEHAVALNERRGFPSAESAVRHSVAILGSTKELLEGGFVGDVRRLVRGELLGDLLEQGEELVREGFPIPAAIVARVVLENWLRGRAEALSLPDFATKKAAQVNDDLKAAGEYPVPKWRQIQAYLDLGNAAAHGKPFDAADVPRMYDYLKALTT